MYRLDIIVEVTLYSCYRMTEPGRKEKLMKKAERTACWGARDEFWSCMDKKVEECRPFREKYEDMCPASWVVHFDRKYEYEKFKARVKSEGYEKLDTTYGADAGGKEGEDS